MIKKILIVAAVISLTGILLNCQSKKNTSPDESLTNPMSNIPSFDDFKRSVYKDSEGVYIVNGDETITNDADLLNFYYKVFMPDKLIVNTVNGADDIWNTTIRYQITYCISKSSFGTDFEKVKQAMADASAAWETAAGVDFVYKSEFDTNCSSSQNGVIFDVRKKSLMDSGSYLARAFFPNQSRSTRNVIIAADAISGTDPDLTGVLRHELGHTIGLRHEHTRPESGKCFEDNNWRPLTGYDVHSVMHYPQCAPDGTITNWRLELTATDVDGASKLYPKGSVSSAASSAVISSAASSVAVSSAVSSAASSAAAETPLTLGAGYLADSLTAGQTKWYSFNGVSGQTYKIYWDDKYSGSGSKTCDVKVSAYRQNKTTAYFTSVDSAYSTPKTLVASATETVYIKVVGYYSYSAGSFGIKAEGSAVSSSAASSAASSIVVSSVASSVMSSAVSSVVSSAASSTVAANFSETFSANGPDKTGWSGTWTMDTSDHTGNGGKSAFGNAAKSSPGNVTQTYSITVTLGSAPVLSYWRKLSMYKISSSDTVKFQVIINDGTDKVVDEKAVTSGYSYSESTFTQRSGISLSAYANKTVTLKFVTYASTSIYMNTYAKAWIDDITIQ